MAAFLRVINALENIRSSNELLSRAVAAESRVDEFVKPLLQRAAAETTDAIEVLQGAGLHPSAVANLEVALELIEQAIASSKGKQRTRLANQAGAEHDKARDNLTET